MDIELKNNKYGLLLNEQDIKLQRKYFEEMTSLIGVKTIFWSPKKDKDYSLYGEIVSNYNKPKEVNCIFIEHPDQKTLRKLGWAVELNTELSIISAPYDLEGLEEGALFLLPSAFDNSKGKLFKVVNLSGIMIYPASITCQLAPEYKNTFEEVSYMHKHDSFNLLAQEDEHL